MCSRKSCGTRTQHHHMLLPSLFWRQRIVFRGSTYLLSRDTTCKGVVQPAKKRSASERYHQNLHSPNQCPPQTDTIARKKQRQQHGVFAFMSGTSPNQQHGRDYQQQRCRQANSESDRYRRQLQMTRLDKRLGQIGFETELQAQTVGPGAMKYLTYQHT